MMPTGYLNGTRVVLAGLAFAISASPGLGAAKQPQGVEQVFEVLGPSMQLVVVTTQNWNAVDGELQAYERSTPKAKWHRVRDGIPVVVGHTGMAWGLGFHGQPTIDPADPVKKEGDGRAPAGVFKLSSIFGYATPDTIGHHKMPYIQAASSIQCVDDIHSAYYNQIVDRTKVSVDWNTAEEMRRSDNDYKWGVFVDYNSGPAVPGAGSCIFLHVWNGPGIGTVGCTAMPEANVKEILFWLDPKKHPLLAQLPKTYFNKYKAQWGLPSE